MTSKILQASVLSQPPTDFIEIKKWVDDQLESIQRVLHLDLTVEQLMVNSILAKLPEYIAGPVRLSLKTSGAGGGEFKFSPQEFEDAINETIQTWTLATPELAQSLTVHQTSVSRTSSPQDPREIPSAKGDPTSSNTWKGQGGGKGTSHRQKCKLCTGGHATKFCIAYKGSLAKRDKLKALGKCADCSQDEHEGYFCRLQYPCHNCTGSGYHLDYLCPNIAPTSLPTNDSASSSNS